MSRTQGDSPEVLNSEKSGSEGLGDNSPSGSENKPLSVFGWLGMLFAVFCWGLSFPLLKVALAEVEPITLAALRYAIGTILLLAILLIKKGKSGLIVPLKEDFGFFFSLGIIGITIPNLFQNWGMTMTSAHLSSIIQASGPVFTIILAVLILKEPLGRNKVTGTAMALTGTVLLVTGAGDNGGSTMLGNFLVMISAIAYAFSSILSKKILEKYDPLTLAALTTLLGTFVLLVFSFSENPIENVPKIPINHWYIIIVLGLLPGSLALVVWFEVLKTSELSRVILFIWLIPIFAAAISYFWPGEEILPTTIILGALILCGVGIAQYEKSKNRKNEPENQK